MRWSLLAALLLGMTALAFAPTARAEPAVTGVEVQAPSRVTVGDRFHVIVTMTGATNTRLALAPGTLPGEYALISTPKATSHSIGNGQSEIKFDMEIAAFFTGDAIIPSLTLDYAEPDGTTGQIQTPEARLFISSVLPTDGSAITPRDLKPQFEIGSASSLGIFAAALALVLVALAVVTALIIRSMRRKPAPAPVAVDTSGMSPEDRARAILEAAGAAFAADRDFVRYYSTIAVTIRNYLTERYGFHAFALTTIELRNEMNRRGIDRWQARLVDGLLTQCDSAVYARYMPALERADHDLTAAYEIVEMSRPKPEAAEAAEREEVAAR